MGGRAELGNPMNEAGQSTHYEKTLRFRTSGLDVQPSLSGGANQFPGGSCTRCSPATFSAHFFASYP
jgi:hypothetical protein